MGGYHDAFAITRKGQDAVVQIDGQFCVYTSMHVAAHNLGVLAKANPGVEFTIRQFRMRLPWTKQGF
ncbi:hypothetical protein HL10_gp170 [Cronobacter phage CR8]|uniref:Uncharacterized protein n=1 Tax=Cronobacter phage CR8 TaxID=1327934 RepID=A0A060ACQ2_9CAUD|nr:hypothetical protein HL10_gp170 [Cronobacter phage CR8]AIA64700.1 hypothetical protein CR8_170 [Cronobacter phage CR8]